MVDASPSDPVGSVLAVFLSHGLPGAVMVALFWYHLRKDAEWRAERAALVADLKAESAARVDDVKGYTELVKGHIAQLSDAVNKMSQASEAGRAIVEEVRRLYRAGRT